MRDREKTVYETGIIQGQDKTGKRKGQDRNKKGYKIRLKKCNAGWGRVVSSSTIWTSIVCLYNSIRSFNYETIKDNKSLGIIVVVFIFLFVFMYRNILVNNRRAELKSTFDVMMDAMQCHDESYFIKLHVCVCIH